MSRLFKRILMLAFSVMLMSGCGGTGGDGDADLDIDTTNIITGVSLSGLVSASAGVSTASIASSDYIQGLEDVSVTIEAFNSSDEAIATILGTTDENGAFQISLPDFSEDDTGGLPERIIATFTKDGYVLGSKTWSDFGSNDTQTFNVLLAQEFVATKTVDELAFSANGKRAFRFGLVRHGNGQIAAIGGSSLNRAHIASSDEVLLEMEVPADSVNPDTTAVTARMGFFDPNDSTDVQSFPGEFVGSGDTTDTAAGINIDAQGNEEEYRLISSTFAQVRLQDQDGNELTLADSGSGKPGIASADNPKITLLIPAESYPNITEDWNDDPTDGLQVPIYIYSGGWKYAGAGTVVTYVAGTGYVLYDDDPLLPLTVEPLYAQLEVTEGNQWVQWVNLDKPIRTGSNFVEVCLVGELKYQGTNDPYNGNLNIRLPDGGYEYSYVQDGMVDHTTLISSTAAAINDVDSSVNPPTTPHWSFNLYNQRNGRYEDLRDDYSLSLLTIDQATNCKDLGTIELVDPRQCRVFGTVTNEVSGSAVTDQWVRGFGFRFWEWAQTDDNGNYEMRVPCGQSLSVSFGGTSAVANVNGTTDADESSDDGTEAQVDLVTSNQAPDIWGISAPDNVLIPSTGSRDVNFNISGYDGDGPLPLTLTLSVKDDQGAEVGGTANSASVDGNYVFEQFTRTFTSPGLYDWTVTLSDGNKSDSESGQLLVESGNRAPRITLLSRDGQPVGMSDQIRVNDTETYEVAGFDRDGDPISFSWDFFDAGVSCSEGGAGQSCTITPTAATPANDPLSMMVTVTDDPSERDDGLTVKSDSQTVAITVTGNQPPNIIFAFARPTRVLADSNGANSEAIALAASAIDDYSDGRDGRPALTYDWSVTGAGLASPLTYTGAEATIPTAALPETARYSVSLTVSDQDPSGALSTTRDFSVVVGEAVDVNVTIR